MAHPRLNQRRIDSLRGKMLGRPYAILQPEHHADPLEFLHRLLNANISTIQIRTKQLRTSDLQQFAEAAAQVIHNHDGLLIINDYVDIATTTGADGVHLGQTDLAITEARSLLGPNKLIGLSTHNLTQLRQAILEPIDYVALGPIHQSPTKSGHAPEVGVKVLEEACKLSPLPVVAIGGINEGNIAAIYAAGATCAAVISVLEKSTDLQKTACALSY